VIEAGCGETNPADGVRGVLAGEGSSERREAVIDRYVLVEQSAREGVPELADASQVAYGLHCMGSTAVVE
jgi:hypothetical protein